MNSLKMKILALVACCFAVIVICGCGDSKNTPKPQQTGGAATQAGGVSTNEVPPTGATASLPTNAVTEKAASKDEKPRKLVEPEINGIGINGLRTITLKVSDTPDLEAVLDYVKIEPNPGPVTIDYYPWNQTVYLNADYQPQTEYHVTVKSGLPFANGQVSKFEVRRTLVTGNRLPSVDFAVRGRYLPPAGRRAIAIETVNVTNLECSISPVPRARRTATAAITAEAAIPRRRRTSRARRWSRSSA